MRHRKIGRILNRKRKHVKLMFYNMSNSLLTHGYIKTTISKAKELKRFFEPLITLSKIDNTSNRRFVFSKIRNKKNVDKLFNKIGPEFFDKKGGYTRILKSEFRKGDNASMAYVILTNSSNTKKT